MNALEIIDSVREHDAELLLQDDKLVIRGRGERLPDELKAVIHERRAEIMLALGALHDAAVASILSELRPHLPPALRVTSDANLLVLVNWSILHAWGKAVASVQS